MDDYISRRAAIDAVHKSIIDFFDICDDDEESPMTYKDEQLLKLNKAITTQIKAVPSEDVVEVVRCKDCIHYMPYDWMFSEVRQSQNIADYPQAEIGCEWIDHHVKPDDYCSLGERRGGE